MIPYYSYIYPMITTTMNSLSNSKSIVLLFLGVFIFRRLVRVVVCDSSEK